MMLDSKSAKALDWDLVLEALAGEARSERGQIEALKAPLAQSLQEAEELYQAVKELEDIESMGDRMPTGGLVDTGPLLNDAQKGRVLELEDLYGCGLSLKALFELQQWLSTKDAPVLCKEFEVIEDASRLHDRFKDSFLGPNALNPKRYPKLAKLKAAIQSAQASIQRKMEALLSSPHLQDLLQDQFVTQRNGRSVLPIRASAKRTGIGIVHDSSASGETVFIEPKEVIELHNQQRLAEAALLREELAIRQQLSQEIGAQSQSILRGLEAGWRLDLTAARLGLGIRVGGQIPEMRDEGCIDLVDAKHPLLSLTESVVVANDLSLHSDAPGLVLSGPNAGGKTVALKSLALAALFAKSGIPFPCRSSSRVDFFHSVLADIGDSQALSDGLSTFSAHMLTLKHCLDKASAGTLVLLDELAVGTDPAQGAALARVVLQALVEKGAKVVCTTHYNELKGLPSLDKRFRTGAVAFQDGRPTYRLSINEVGLSHAFAIAVRMGLPEDLIGQAKQALGEHERQWIEEKERAAEEREALVMEREILKEKIQAVESDKVALNARLAKIKKEKESILSQEREASRQRLREAEKEIKALIAKLQSQPSLRSAGKALMEVRSLHVDKQEPSSSLKKDPSKVTLSIGDKVLVQSLGREGIVAAPPKGHKVEIRFGSIKSLVERSDCVLQKKHSERIEKRPSAPQNLPLQSTLRTPSNTLDCRGLRVDEAIQALDLYLDQLLQRGGEIAYVLHGHGTGALKKALRDWIRTQPTVESWRPASDSEGGDAFTQIRLR